MRHLGDVTKLNGYAVPVVDCITGGSPCQDLSIAGKRAGLAGERSGLFLEQIRIIKEMRARDRLLGKTGANIRPRYMVWENVIGAFSSNKGKDFAAVLTETIRVICPEAPDVPVPKLGGGWPNAGCIYDVLGRWSVAWRVHDAKFWGVPQRRRRIALIADFGGYTAPEILFERKGLSWHPSEEQEAGETAAAGAGGGADKAIYALATQQGGAEIGINYCPTITVAAGMSGNNQPVICLNDQGGSVMETSVEVTGTLRAQEHGHQPIICAGFKHKAGAGAGSVGFEQETSPCLNAEQVGAVLYENHAQDSRITGPLDVAPAVNATYGTGGNNTPLVMASGQTGAEITKDMSPTLNCSHEQPITLTPWDNQARRIYDAHGPAPALNARANNGQNQQAFLTHKTVRRLTPLECERLQGFPDGWTLIGELTGYAVWTDKGGNEYPDAIYKYTGMDGKKHKTSDSARYRALGNSIALPFWDWLLARISAQYDRPATLGSLFDGIGGFPLCWERHNGPGTAVWASEIDDFCIAVTQRRFPE